MREMNPKHKEAWELRKDGWSFSKIAERLEYSIEGARYAVRKASETYGPPRPTDSVPLSARTTQTIEVRVIREESLGRLASPSEVLAYMVGKHEANTWAEERFWVLVLNTQNEVIAEQEVSRGTLDASVVHPREVFWLAVHERAASIMLVHNHPSGDPAPSPADREVTRQLTEAGRVLGIPVRDHVIIGLHGRYSSFLDMGLLFAE